MPYFYFYFMALTLKQTGQKEPESETCLFNQIKTEEVSRFTSKKCSCTPSLAQNRGRKSVYNFI